jgi:hypothetical protein
MGGRSGGVGVQPAGAGRAVDNCDESIGKDRQLTGDVLNRCDHIRQLALESVWRIMEAR